MGLKNLWSLQIDELVVTETLKSILGRRYEVFIPLNSMLADIDLLLMNLNSRRCITLQVKGSRTYEPRKTETVRYGNGSATWFTLRKDRIFQPTNQIDFYIFVLHSFQDDSTKKSIVIDFLVVPTKEFRNICLKKKTRGGGNRYDFFIWIDPRGKRAFDIEGGAGTELEMSKYLNNWKPLMK